MNPIQPHPKVILAEEVITQVPGIDRVTILNWGNDIAKNLIRNACEIQDPIKSLEYCGFVSYSWFKMITKMFKYNNAGMAPALILQFGEARIREIEEVYYSKLYKLTKIS